MNKKTSWLSFAVVVLSTAIKTAAPELGLALDPLFQLLLGGAVFGGAGLLLVSESITKK